MRAGKRYNNSRMKKAGEAWGVSGPNVSACGLRAASVKAAGSNGVWLEVSYNAALMDTAARRNFFANATAVVRAVGSGTGGGGVGCSHTHTRFRSQT